MYDKLGECHVMLVGLINSDFRVRTIIINVNGHSNTSKLLRNHALANQDVFTFCDVKKIFLKDRKIDRSLYKVDQEILEGEGKKRINVGVGEFIATPRLMLLTIITYQQV